MTPQDIEEFERLKAKRDKQANVMRVNRLAFIDKLPTKEDRAAYFRELANKRWAKLHASKAINAEIDIVDNA